MSASSNGSGLDRPLDLAAGERVASEEAAPARPDINPWVVAIAVMFGTFMVFLDTTVVNLSLPYMAGSLAASVDESTWALTSYLAANAIILPLTGWIANYFGRKRVILTSLVTFTFASLLCGMAPNLASLVVFRILQGLSGGSLQPLSQAVLLESFPHRDRGKAMGFWSVGIVLAPILGPVIGGYITANYSWRWVFFINIPVGVVALTMVQLYVFDPVYIRRRSQSIDLTGIALLALSIGALQIMLDKGQQEDWLDSRFIVTLLVGGLLGLLVFVVWELRCDHPVVDLRVFRFATFSVGAWLSAQVGFILFGSIVLLPLMLQTQLGYSPLQAGFALVPRGLGAFIAFPIVGMIVEKFDPRKLLVLGLALGGFTMAWLTQLDLDLGYWDLFAPQFIQGIALGLLFVPLTTVSMDPISNEIMGNATAVYNVIRNFGSSIGIAVVATLLARRPVQHWENLRSHVDAYDPLTLVRLQAIQDRFLGMGLDPATAADAAYRTLGRLVAQQAGVLSFLDVFRLLGWLFLVMVPLVFLMRRPERH